MTDAAEIRDKVRERYAEAAQSVEPSCCDTDCSAGADAFETSASGDFGTWRYEADQLSPIPDGAALASLGCGNPTAVAELVPGETVLDLGSGAGIDVLLSARRVGPDGFAYGIDMTDEMLELARQHQREAGATNVEFRKGMIEDIPLENATVEVRRGEFVVLLGRSGSGKSTLLHLLCGIEPPDSGEVWIEGAGETPTREASPPGSSSDQAKSSSSS